MFHKFSPLVRQYLVVITVNLSMLGTGLGLTWPSPVLVKLRDEDLLPEPITDNQGSWVVSIGFLAAIFACFLAMLLLTHLGRKYTIFLACVPKIGAGLLFVFVTDLWMLLLGRAIVGSCDAILFTSVPMYASEVASKEIRGSLGTILQIVCSIGVVSMLCVGPFITYLTLNILYTLVIVITTAPLLFLPESPFFLYSKGRNAEAVKVLTFLQGSETQALEEMKEFSQATSSDTSFKDVIKIKTFWKSFGLVLVLVIGAQLTGFTTISCYLQTILETTGTSISPEVGSVIIGLIQLLASFCTASVTDRFGRKPILTSTLVGLAVGMIGLGIFFFFQTDDEPVQGFMNFLPLLSLVIVVFCYSAGVGSLNWVVSAELFEDRARGVGLSLIFVLTYVITFIMTKYFPLLLEAIGPATYLWLSANSWLLFFFIMFFIPETKGKTIAEIQAKLGAKPVETKDKKEELDSRNPRNDLEKCDK